MSPGGAGPGEREVPGINLGVPHPARVYDYFLGGKDNFEADRAAGEAGIRAFPKAAESARASRAFLRRVVRFLAGEGVRQFLDIGTGLPSGENVHQVAQSLAPEARIVYADNDPIVLAHAHALLTGNPPGPLPMIAVHGSEAATASRTSAAQNGRSGRFRSAGCVRAAALTEAMDRAETRRSI